MRAHDLIGGVIRASLLFATFLSLFPAAASALTLVPVRSFGTDATFGDEFGIAPEGLAFGVEDVNGTPTPVLYVSEGNSCNPCTVFVYDATATDSGGTPPAPLRSFGIPLNDVRGLDVMPNGNLLVSSVGGLIDRVVEVSRTTGAVIAGGVDRTVGPLGTIAATQPESVIVHNGVGTAHPGVASIFLGEEETPGTIFDLQFDGTINSSFPVGPLDDPNPLSPGDSLFEDPSGMDYDPATGVLLIADDSSGAGMTKLYAVSPAGSLVGAPVDLRTLLAGFPDCQAEGPGTCDDPEGVAFDTETGNLIYLAFENQNRVVTFEISNIPEPGTLGLLAAGLAGLGLLRRRARV